MRWCCDQGLSPAVRRCKHGRKFPLMKLCPIGCGHHLGRCPAQGGVVNALMKPMVCPWGNLGCFFIMKNIWALRPTGTAIHSPVKRLRAGGIGRNSVILILATSRRFGSPAGLVGPLPWSVLMPVPAKRAWRNFFGNYLKTGARKIHRMKE